MDETVCLGRKEAFGAFREKGIPAAHKAPSAKGKACASGIQRNAPVFVVLAESRQAEGQDAF